MKILKYLLLSTTVLWMAASPAKAAQLTSNVRLDTELKAQGIGVHNGDLGASGGDNDSVGALAGKFKLLADINKNTLFFTEAKAVGSVGDGGVESDDTGEIVSSNSYLELRQLYFQFNDLSGIEPLNLKLGRQRITEPYGVWWNKDFDAVRLTYDTTIFKGSLGAGQNLTSYRTGPGDFNKNDEDIARVLAEGSWQYHYNQFFEARAMYQDDHSGPHVGDVEKAGDADSRDGRLLWGGLRAMGKAFSLGRDSGKMSYRLDLMSLMGSEDVATRSAPVGGSTTITGFNNRDVRGWAFDGAVDVPLPSMSPILHLGYAFGSGDDNTTDGTDHSFRQTGLDGNFSRVGALTRNTDNYGTVLRPDLANIHVLSAGFTMPVREWGDMGAIYRYYELDELSTSLPTSGVNNSLTGTSKQLGQGLDLLFNVDLMKATGRKPDGIQEMGLRTSLGFYRSGQAYGARDGETATRGLIELRVLF